MTTTERRGENHDGDDDGLMKKQRIDNQQNNASCIQLLNPRDISGTWAYEVTSCTQQAPPFLIDFFETERHEADCWKFREETGGNLLYRLPVHVIQHIATRFLNPIDYLNFRSISKCCRRLLAPQAYNKDLPLSPCFIRFDNQSGICNLLDSKLVGMYFLKTPKFLLDATILNLNHGWLVVMDSLRTLVFYNPFTTKIIKLPALNLENCYVGFSSSPASSKCIVAVISPILGAILIDIFRVEKNKWDSYRFDNDDGYVHKFYNVPVFHDGSFYVFLNDGRLGVLDVKDDERISWNFTMATKEHCHYLSWWNFIMDTEEYCHYLSFNYLLECAGKLLLVSGRKGYDLVVVQALDWTTMSWEKVSDLANHTVYVSSTASFSTPASADWMRNTIFFTSRFTDRVVYYSMSTGKYDVIANKNDVVKYKNTGELLNSGWIQPSWS